MEPNPELLPIRSVSAELSGNEAFLGNLIQLQKLYVARQTDRQWRACAAATLLAPICIMAAWAASTVAVCAKVQVMLAGTHPGGPIASFDQLIPAIAYLLGDPICTAVEPAIAGWLCVGAGGLLLLLDVIIPLGRAIRIGSRLMLTS
eukprot:Protomagalhaensia_sp_Gyna_25__286@NODE_1134_length_2152_cov_13_693800_g900_i0_p2_GENE_NODE_1134_length_2152_cov_13_693800_g900_i0NODE_1134_length_2152_cov_13_693800_g900_i0_p2_ORF_typecomplete_len147_score9_35DUF3040/PF11239_8/1DUF3040/PF11239_8/2_6e02_NODE_1134_length_2152_cov_13_693800_g900_i06061046